MAKGSVWWRGMRRICGWAMERVPHIPEEWSEALNCFFSTAFYRRKYSAWFFKPRRFLWCGVKSMLTLEYEHKNLHKYHTSRNLKWWENFFTVAMLMMSECWRCCIVFRNKQAISGPLAVGWSWDTGVDDSCSRWFVDRVQSAIDLLHPDELLL